mgnify:FL=1
METRPKIKLTLSSLDSKLESAGKAFLIILWALTLFVFLKLPATIPTHFNASGKADNYGSRMTILISPILATIIYFGLAQLNKYPRIFNYMVKITENNAPGQYKIATRVLRFLKLAVLIIFSLIILFTYLTATGMTNGLGLWFLPFTSGLLLIPTILIVSQSLKKKNTV